MIFHCTEKMRKKLHLPPLTQVADETGPHLRWYVNAFTAQRVQYVLTTNAASLLSVVLPGRGLTDGAAYQRAFLESLGTYLGELEQRLVFERVILPRSGALVFAKTANSSVLGTMKKIVCDSIYGLEHRGFSAEETGRWINERPCKAIEYKYPREAFASLSLR